MVNSIMVPIELAHTSALDSAVVTAGELAKSNNASLTLIGVTGTAPNDAAKNPHDYQTKFSAYVSEVSSRLGIPVEARALVDNDVAADLGNVLINAAEEMDVDLIVMASHVPGFIEHIFTSNAGYVASHAKCSVYVIR